MHYKDTGCDVAPSCLMCPLDVCILEQPKIDPRVVAWAKRNAKIMTLSKERSVREIAQQTGLSMRTIERIIRQGKRNNGCVGDKVQIGKEL